MLVIFPHFSIIISGEGISLKNSPGAVKIADLHIRPAKE